MISPSVSIRPDIGMKKRFRLLKASNYIMTEHHPSREHDHLQEFCERLDRRMEAINNLLYLASVSTDDLFMTKQFARRAMEEMRIARTAVREHCRPDVQDLPRVS